MRTASIPDILNQHGVRYTTDVGRHVRPGWIGMACPFCSGTPGDHLGFNLSKGYFYCWRCGAHDQVSSLSTLCSISRGEAFALWKSAAPAREGSRTGARDREAQARVVIGPYKRPSLTGPMSITHWKYLEGRGFDPDEIENVWGVEGTGPVSYLDKIDYRHRLFMPIIWNGKEVSFQTRDVTGKSELKYKACLPARETVHHRNIVYTHPDHGKHRVGIVVEGVVDAWRLGTMACATFGTQFSLAQAAVIATMWDRVAVVFDPERPAQKQARKLAERLRIRGIAAISLKPPPGIDPGDMGDDDARHFVAEIERWGAMV